MQNHAHSRTGQEVNILNAVRNFISVQKIMLKDMEKIVAPARRGGKKFAVKKERAVDYKMSAADTKYLKDISKKVRSGEMETYPF